MQHSNQNLQLTSDELEKFCELLSIASLEKGQRWGGLAGKAIDKYLKYLAGNVKVQREVNLLLENIAMLAKEEPFVSYQSLFLKVSLEIKSAGAQLDEILEEETLAAFSERMSSKHHHRKEAAIAQLDISKLRLIPGMELSDRYAIHLQQENNESIASAYGRLGSEYYKHKEYPEACAQYLLAITALNKQPLEELSDEGYKALMSYHQILAIIYGNLASKQSNQGEEKLALECWTQAISHFTEVSPAFRTKAANGLLSECYGGLAQIYSNHHDYDKARFQWLKAIEELKQIKPEQSLDGLAYCHNALALVYGKLGVLEQEQGRFKEACIFFRQTLAELDEISEEFRQETFKPSLAHYRDCLARNYGSLGSRCYHQGEFKEACECWSLAMDELNEIPQEVQDNTQTLANYRYALALAYGKLGDKHQEKGEFKEAYENWNFAISEFWKVDPKLRPEGFMATLLEYMVRLGDALLSAQNYQEAASYFCAVVNEFNKKPREQLTEEERQSLVNLHDKLALAYGQLGYAYSAKGEAKEASLYWGLAIAELRKQMVVWGVGTQSKVLAGYYNVMAKSAFHQQAYQEALEYGQSAISELTRLVPASVGEEVRVLLAHYHDFQASVYGALAERHEESGEKTEAAEFWRLAIHELNSIPGELMSEESKKGLEYYKKALDAHTSMPLTALVQSNKRRENLKSEDSLHEEKEQIVNKGKKR